MSGKFKIALLSMLILAASSTVYASGFAIIEQSVTGLGSAFAGAAASAEDASTVYYNPAGMMLLEGQQVKVGVNIVAPTTELDLDGASKTTALGTVSLGTETSGDAAADAVVPNLYYTNKINDRFAVGLGITAPFGMTVDYDEDWAGRYHAVKSDVLTININPAVAYRVNDKLSVGAGVSAQYIDATLSSMADAGYYYGESGNTDYDVLVENSGDDWGYGFNLGLIYEITQATRIGLNYRSEYKHTLEGTVECDVPDKAAALSSYFETQDIIADITLPAAASLSVYHQLTDKLALLADISWTQWSSFDELTISFENYIGSTDNTESSTVENWDDSWRYSIGAIYQATDALTLRTGVAFDETPISDEYRTPRIPGEDRFWLTFGLSYNITNALSIDAAYAHIFVDDATLDLEDSTAGDISGTYEASVDIASIQLSYNF
jgi:long-chain fatty acid transport protein